MITAKENLLNFIEECKNAGNGVTLCIKDPYYPALVMITYHFENLTGLLVQIYNTYDDQLNLKFGDGSIEFHAEFVNEG